MSVWMEELFEGLYPRMSFAISDFNANRSAGNDLNSSQFISTRINVKSICLFQVLMDHRLLKVTPSCYSPSQWMDIWWPICVLYNEYQDLKIVESFLVEELYSKIWNTTSSPNGTLSYLSSFILHTNSFASSKCLLKEGVILCKRK